MRGKSPWLSVIAVLLLLPALAAAPPPEHHRVKDLNVTPRLVGSDPGPGMALAGFTYFAAADETRGRELWRTDGTTAGTSLFIDLWPGLGSSSPTPVAVLGSKLVFGANDGQHGDELWATDGTVAGTALLLDIAPGAANGRRALASQVVGNTLFFAATDSRGSELWKTDGTPTGTALVLDIAAGASSGVGGPIHCATSTLAFFYANGPSTQLWRSDGTPAGTFPVTPTGIASFSTPVCTPSLAVVALGDATSGTEPWVSDGTVAGTRVLVDAVAGPTGSSPGVITVNGSKLFFSAGGGAWASDGTPAGTVRLGTFTAVTEAIAFGAGWLFAASDAANGAEVRITTGTVAGTTLVLNVAAGAASSNPVSLFNAGPYALFVASDGVTSSLWSTDGTAAGTGSLAPLLGASGHARLGNTVYFSGNDATAGVEPWSTNGTAAGTRRLADLTLGTASSTPSFIGGAGVSMLFSADEPTLARELWRSDGTAAGTTLLRDIFTGLTTASSSPSRTTAVGSLVYFIANGGDGGAMWRSDGTEVGTVALTQGRTSANFSSGVFATSSGRFFFVATDSSGQQLWSSDGTPAGTSSRTTGLCSSVDEILGVTDDTVFFSATAAVGTSGEELWATDGTDAGTRLVRDLMGGSSNPRSGLILGSKLIFTAGDNQSPEPWVSDGTSANTIRLMSSPSPIASLGGTAVGNTAFIHVTGSQMMRTSGTVATTRVIPGFTAAAPDVDIGEHDVALATGLLTVGNDSTHGNEPTLFTFDGGGTLLRDIATGTASSSTRMLSSNGSLALFAANDGVRGLEPYITDGTPAGTRLLADLNPAGSSNPVEVGAIGNLLLFSANDGDAGIQLWVTNGGAAPVSISTVRPAAVSPNVTRVRALDRLYFVATDNRLWVTDGTAAGTAPTRPSATAVASAPNHLAATADRVFFAATDPTGDRELYYVLLDESPPEVTPVITGTPGNNGFYVSNVDLTWQVVDAESAVTMTSGCTPSSVVTDTAGISFTCDATSLGGVRSVTTTLKRDTTRPIMTCSAVPIVTEATSSAGAAFNYPLPTAQDLIDPAPVISADPLPGSTFAIGDTSVTSTATDLAGNIASCMFTITVRDSTAPAPMCPAAGLTVEASGPAGALVTLEATATDAVDATPVISFAPPSGSTFPVGDRQVVVTATDATGNAATCSYLVHVVDRVGPTLSCPERQTVPATSASGATVDFTLPTATDVVDAEPVVTANHSPKDTFPPGITSVQIVATDHSGNAAQCSFEIEVTCDEVLCPNRVAGRSPYAFGFCGCSSGPFSILPLALLLAWRRRRRGPTLLVLALLVLALPAFAAEGPVKKAKLGYVGVSAGTGVTEEEARGMSELLQAELAATGAYDLVTASDISAMLGLERQKQLMGCGEESSCMAEMAGALDVDRMLTGTVTRTGETLVMNLALLDVRSNFAISRATRQEQSSRFSALSEAAPEAMFEVLQRDPLNDGKTFARDRRFGGLVVGARVDGDLLNLGVAPAITAEFSGKYFGGALAVLIKQVPGVRLEGRFYPVTLGPVRPWVAVGSTAFLTGIGLRGAVGAAVRIASIQVFADLGYERFFNLGTATTANNVLVLGAGAGWWF